MFRSSSMDCVRNNFSVVLINEFFFEINSRLREFFFVYGPILTEPTSTLMSIQKCVGCGFNNKTSSILSQYKSQAAVNPKKKMKKIDFLN